MKPSNNVPRPENSPLGSPESRAAARLLAEKRKEAPIPVIVTHVTGVIDGDAEHEPKEWNIDDELSFTGQAIYSPLDPETMGNTPACRMTRQELRILEAKQREYDDEYEKHCAIERDDSRPSQKEVCDPAAFDEKKPGLISPTADAPQQTELESSEDDAAREARVEEYGKSLARRSHTGPSPQLRRAWWRWGL